jgi:hypothetical protein
LIFPDLKNRDMRAEWDGFDGACKIGEDVWTDQSNLTMDWGSDGITISSLPACLKSLKFLKSLKSNWLIEKPGEYPVTKSEGAILRILGVLSILRILRKTSNIADFSDFTFEERSQKSSEMNNYNNRISNFFICIVKPHHNG